MRLLRRHGLQATFVLATGFQANRLTWPMRIAGRGGKTLRDLWGDDDPRAYLGITVPGFPNFFLMYGPNTNHISGSVPYTLECQYNYALDAIRRVREKGVYSELVRPRYDPGRAYQWGTLVRPEHRGHRLGIAVKVANLRLLQRERPDLGQVITWNAEVNSHMIGVNEAMGFVPVKSLQELLDLVVADNALSAERALHIADAVQRCKHCGRKTCRLFENSVRQFGVGQDVGVGGEQAEGALRVGLEEAEEEAGHEGGVVARVVGEVCAVAVSLLLLLAAVAPLDERQRGLGADLLLEPQAFDRWIHGGDGE